MVNNLLDKGHKAIIKIMEKAILKNPEQGTDIKSPESFQPAIGDRNDYSFSEKLFVESYEKFSDNLKAKKIISIDIDKTGFRVLYLSKLNNTYQIKRLGEEPFASSNPAAVQNDIKSIPRILRRRSIQNAEIVLCLSGPEIFITTVYVPEMSGDELKEAIYWTINKDTFIISETDIWDYQILGKAVLNEKPVLKIQVICARDKYIRTYVDLLKSINIQVDRIIAKPVALISAIKLLKSVKFWQKQNILIVDAGKAYTQLIICADGNPDMNGLTPLGCNEITNNLVEITQEEPETENSDKDRMKVHKHPLVFEIKKIIASFKNKHHNENVDTILITDISDASEKLEEILSGEFSIPVLRLEPPFPDNKITKKIQKSNYSAALGAAGSDFNLFTLLPKDIELAKHYKKYHRFAGIFAIILTAFIVVFSLQLNEKVKKKESMRKTIQSEYESVQNIEAEYYSLLDKVEELNQQKKTIYNTLKPDEDLIRNLKILSNYTPDNITLNYMDVFSSGAGEIYEFKKLSLGILNLRGQVVKNFMFADLTLNRFIKTLQNLKTYESIRLVKKEKNMDEQVLKFELEIRLR